MSHKNENSYKNNSAGYFIHSKVCINLVRVLEYISNKSSLSFLKKKTIPYIEICCSENDAVNYKK